ncbi:MAG: hypothetical protein ABIV21_08215 [Pyrinomonadaceae bacterium]
MGVLLMLITIGGLVVAGVLLVVSAFGKKTWLRNFTLRGTAVWFVFYAVMLIGSSIFSKERTLSLNEAKEYCGFYLDCHMHTAVIGVRTAKTLGNRTGNGEFYIIKVKVFSDAKQALLGLLTVDAHVVDDRNNQYSRDMFAESQLTPQPDFEQKILPAESFEKEIVFDLPSDMKNPRLDLREGYGVDHVIEAILIDDEDSICHKRNYFKLQEQNETASQNRER